MKNILAARFTGSSNKFDYFIRCGSKFLNRTNIEICENAFIFLLGFKARSRQYNDIKQLIQRGYNIFDEVTYHPRERDSAKYLHAKLFIENFVHDSCDILPLKTSDNSDVYCLPYGSIKAFYEEYVTSSKVNGNDETTIASETRFRVCFTNEFSRTVRLMRCKGNFSTCDICNNAADLLNDHTREFTKEQREIIMNFRRLHLKQQSEEREEMARKRHRARSDRDRLTGQPLSFFMLCDAMTSNRGDLPVLAKVRKSKSDVQK